MKKRLRNNYCLNKFYINNVNGKTTAKKLLSQQTIENNGVTRLSSEHSPPS